MSLICSSFFSLAKLKHLGLSQLQPSDSLDQPVIIYILAMSMMMELRVPNLDCEGCANKLRKALLKLKGVDDVEVDRDTKKITVRGYNLQERKVLKAIKLTGKAAEMWPFPGYSHHFAAFYKYPSHVISHYYNDMHAVQDAGKAAHSFFHTPALYSVAVASDEAAASLFSDDNVHACSIM